MPATSWWDDWCGCCCFGRLFEWKQDQQQERNVETALLERVEILFRKWLVALSASIGHGAADEALFT